MICVWHTIFKLMLREMTAAFLLYKVVWKWRRSGEATLSSNLTKEGAQLALRAPKGTMGSLAEVAKPLKGGGESNDTKSE